MVPESAQLTAQSVQSLALTMGYFVGGFLAWLVYDLLIEIVVGHTGTISHGFAWLGLAYPWFRCVWLALLIGLAVFLYWHFWGWVKPW